MTVRQWLAMREENLTGYSPRVAQNNAAILLTSSLHGKVVFVANVAQVFDGKGLQIIKIFTMTRARRVLAHTTTAVDSAVIFRHCAPSDHARLPLANAGRQGEA
ncbi:hypothetical protein HUS70_07095 [Pandoraea nosoerga]|uniref:hypothetical protein n=1 Tax=Pandoraea nosoerga TaxID=2508296 RepID=UPI00123FC7A7|nr:hypothetical protein [Pandoraea nosoerga]MBN4665497.1 hypothetical protein [Pandoraea nosoerga]MBN4675022.1 hypothetical protein [Pandoraea nosoerga]MBN4680338.1 hypothetical protein [Pandoraea nosoerga]MBN4744429.1 hypothetical protein [Pandoraea nosoerga]